MAHTDKGKGEGWEKHWEIVNNQLPNGVNPQAYRLGFLDAQKLAAQQEAGQSSQSVVPCLKKYPELYTGSLCMKCFKSNECLDESNQSVDETASQFTEPLQQDIYRLEELVRSKNEEIERLKGLIKEIHKRHSLFVFDEYEKDWELFKSENQL